MADPSDRSIRDRDLHPMHYPNLAFLGGFAFLWGFMAARTGGSDGLAFAAVGALNVLWIPMLARWPWTRRWRDVPFRKRWQGIVPALNGALLGPALVGLLDGKDSFSTWAALLGFAVGIALLFSAFWLAHLLRPVPLSQVNA